VIGPTPGGAQTDILRFRYDENCVYRWWLLVSIIINNNNNNLCERNYYSWIFYYLFPLHVHVYGIKSLCWYFVYFVIITPFLVVPMSPKKRSISIVRIRY